MGFSHFAVISPRASHSKRFQPLTHEIL